MGKNTDYNIIDESWDCNQSAVESSSKRVTNADRVSFHEHDEIGGISQKFLSSKHDRINGQSK